MKKKNKKILKILSVAVLSMFAFTGCATVSNIQNDYSELIFNGGQAVQVGDYLYYGNGYTAVGSSATDFAYDASANVSYMNRINLTNNFGKPLDAQKDTEKVNSKVIGYENQYMFVLGDFVYYTSANTHKTSSLENAYNLVSFFRCRLNGDNVEEFYTTSTFDSSKSELRVLKGYDDNYYFIIFDGSELSSIRLGSSLGGREVIATDVQSLAMPNENDEYSYKQILYTVNKTEEGTTSSSSSTKEVEVYSYDYSTNKKTKAISAAAGTKFVGRQGDIVFYTNSTNTIAPPTYYKNLANSSLIFSGNANELFYDRADIKDIQSISVGDSVSEGYIFVGGTSSSVMYRNERTKQVDDKPLIEKDSYTDLLFVDGDYIYYSNSTGIYRISVKNKQPETVIEMTEIVSGKYAYSNNYIYFYAKLENDENDEKTYEEDNNYYMYRVHKEGTGGYQIISNFTRVEVKED